jgi:hypothetical protein
MNQSRLKKILTSPLHYREYQQPDTGSLGLGRALHTAVLEPSEYRSRHPVFSGVRRGKEWEAFRAANPASDIITDAEATKVGSMAGAVLVNRQARPLLDGMPEVPIYWSMHDMECKGRLDMVSGNKLVGLKTTADIGIRAFKFSVVKYHYAFQWAWYRMGWEAWYGTTPELYEIVVQSSPPWDVVVYRIPQAVIDYGAEQIERAFAVLRECEQKDWWPGVAGGQVLDFELPAWCTDSEEAAALNWED